VQFYTMAAQRAIDWRSIHLDLHPPLLHKGIQLLNS
jgi:hypothetical protein